MTVTDHPIPPLTTTLPSIRVQRGSELLADELRQRILDGELPDGTQLPSERELIVQTGLSRSSVRDALRILQTEGLVETRTGRFGGSVVRRPADDALANFLGLFIKGRSIPLTALIEFREAIGGTIAALAAQRRTEADILALQTIAHRQESAVGNIPVYLAENVKWQIALANASHNELMIGCTTAISSLILKATSLNNVASERVRRSVIEAHRLVFDAVVDQDVEKARSVMNKHLRGVTQGMLAVEGGAQAML